MSSTKQKLRLAGAFAALATLAVAVSCKGFFVNPTLTAIGITPATPTITDVPPDNTQQFSAVGTFDDGSSGSTPVTWSSDTPTSVASISPGGLATAVGTGSATITATSTILPTITATTTLMVVPGNVTSIKLTPSSQSIPSNISTFTLLAEDQSGNDISSSVTFTFEVQGTTTVESGITEDTETPGQGETLTIGTLSPTPAPVNLTAFATLTVNNTTVTSNTVAVDIE
jgi:Bacterial Ig-like domain (group 2)